jgi:DNA-binding NarL/FixJ family response regulator
MELNDFRVVVLEDDPFIGEVLRSMVNSTKDFRCEKVYEDPVQFLAADDRPDIILLDVVMPKMTGLDAIVPILEKYPDVSIVMNTIKDDPDTIFSALKRGAVGYIDKQSPGIDFEEVLRTVAGGGGYMSPKIARIVFESFRAPKTPQFEQLTDRERDVTQAILDGLSYKMIAERFSISINTVRMNVKSIYRKLKINSKGELFNIARNKA